jgi:redox-sensing transcriptional repressor
VVAGAGNLGSALMGYTELKNHGLIIAAAFDISEEKQGKRSNGPEVFPFSEMKKVIKKTGARLGIITVPPQAAQEVCDKLIESGIRQIWNFTNVKLKVPDDILVLQEDLSSGYAVLTALKGVARGGKA